MYRKTMREALEEARSYRDPVNEDKGFSSQQIKMAYGVLNDPRYKQGNYSGAYKAIEKIARGLASHPDVANALKRANEELDNDDKETIKPIIKQLQKSVKAHDKQAKQLQKDIQDEVELDEVHFSNRNEPPAPKGMHKLRSGRDIPSTPRVDKIHKKVIAMTDRNDHFGARIEIAKACGDKKLVQIYNALELTHDNYSGAVGNGAIELRNKFSPVLNKAIERKFGKYADVIQDAL